MDNSLKLVQQLIEASYEKDRQDKIADPSKMGESFFTHYLKILNRRVLIQMQLMPIQCF